MHSCKLEIDELDEGYNEEEPVPYARHRANLLEFLRGEVVQAVDQMISDRERVKELSCAEVLPFLQPFPDLGSPIVNSPERIASQHQSSIDKVCQ
jgi:hypothetical protein